MKYIYVIILAALYIGYGIEAIAQALSQPVLMALPSGVDGKDPLTTYTENKNVQAATTAINQVLTEKKLEVRDLKAQMQNFDRLRAKMSALQSDPNALIAASSGADIYLEFSLELIQEGPGKKARVDINVKEAATAKMLGAASGTSKALVTSDISSLCQIAVNDCIARVMEQIRGYWNDIPKNGKPIIITISASSMDLNKPTTNGTRIDREIDRFLKAQTITYRKEMGTAKTIMYNPVYVDVVKFDQVSEFGYLIEDLMSEKGVTGYSVEVEGKSIELTIE